MEKNQELVQHFTTLSEAHQAINEENQAKAYKRVAEIIAGLKVPIEEIEYKPKDGKATIPGIGWASANRITKFLKTGEFVELGSREEIKALEANEELVDIFKQLSLNSESSYAKSAYSKVATKIAKMDKPITEIDYKKTPGIGAESQKVIKEWLADGTCSKLDKLMLSKKE